MSQYCTDIDDNSKEDDEELACGQLHCNNDRSRAHGKTNYPPTQFTEIALHGRTDVITRDPMYMCNNSTKGTISRDEVDSIMQSGHSRNRSFSPTNTMAAHFVSASPQRRGCYSKGTNMPRRSSETAGMTRNFRNSRTGPAMDPFDYSSQPGRGTPRTQSLNTMTRRRQSPRKANQRDSLDSELRSRASIIQNCHMNSHERTLDAPSTSNISDNVKSYSRSTTEADEDLARRMQALEDNGLGRMNSDRVLESLEDSDSEQDAGNNESTPTSKIISRLRIESGAHFNDISDEVLKELLSTSASDQLLIAARNPRNSSIPSSPSISVFRPDVNSIDTEDRARQNERNNIASGDTVRIMLTSSPILKTEPALEFYVSARIPSPIPPASSCVPEISSSVEIQPNNDGLVKSKKYRGLFSKLKGRSTVKNKETGKDQKPAPLGLPYDIPGIPGGIPDAIPPPPNISNSSSLPKTSFPKEQPHSRSNSLHLKGIPAGIPAAGIHGVKPSLGNARSTAFAGNYRGTSVCSACGLTHGSFLKVFDRKYHPECFRCMSCDGKIDPNDQFNYTTDQEGRKHPYHRECYINFEVTCVVCRQRIPANAEGRVPFIKHPFFDEEKMCIRHAEEKHRRCAGCHRFEPMNNPFIDIMDSDRCVCPSCCRSAVVENSDIKILWTNVLGFFETLLKLPVWGPMRNIPILLVGSETLLEQMQAQNHVHTGATNPLIAGLCLTNETNSRDGEVSRYYLNSTDAQQGSSVHKTEVISILCLTGLPSDLTSGVLAHEATHAWIKLHPKFDKDNALPPHIEEGVAQLVASLFLSEGLGTSTKPPSKQGPDGLSDERLRQYFKFCIERETSEVFGSGYRRAALAYRSIGIEALLTHILEYRDFPIT